MIYRSASNIREAFWRFSLAFYARPGVAAALLTLQDRDGCDVNLMLWALWAGAVCGRRLSAADLAAAEREIAELRDRAVLPVRGLRRGLKSAVDSELRELRPRIAALELAVERRVQYRLAAFLGGRGAAIAPDAWLDAAAANLALHTGPQPTPETAELLAPLAGFLHR